MIVSDLGHPGQKWEFKVGTLGEYLGGKKTSSQQVVCVIVYSLCTRFIALFNPLYTPTKPTNG